MNNFDKNSPDSLQERLNNLCDNDMDFMKEFVALFRKNATLAMSAINQNDPKKSVHDIQQVAHKLKSNFLLFEFMEASDLAGEIERSHSHEEMTPIIKRLNVVYLNILDGFSKLN